MNNINQYCPVKPSELKLFINESGNKFQEGKKSSKIQEKVSVKISVKNSNRNGEGEGVKVREWSGSTDVSRSRDVDASDVDVRVGDAGTDGLSVSDASGVDGCIEDAGPDGSFGTDDSNVDAHVGDSRVAGLGCVVISDDLINKDSTEEICDITDRNVFINEEKILKLFDVDYSRGTLGLVKGPLDNLDLSLDFSLNDDIYFNYSNQFLPDNDLKNFTLNDNDIKKLLDNVGNEELSVLNHLIYTLQSLSPPNKSPEIIPIGLDEIEEKSQVDSVNVPYLCGLEPLPSDHESDSDREE